MRSEKLKALIQKYKTGTISPDEKLLLDNWYLQLSKQEPVQVNEQDMQRRLKAVGKNLEVKKPVPVYRWLSAAAALLVVGFGLFFLVRKSESPKDRKIAQADIAPGGNRATLTLADGRTINLDSAANGQLAEQAGIVVRKTADGQIAYELKNNEAESPTVSYNTISTPTGGQYQIILPDKSKVWLNAASSLRYPVRFPADKREVDLTGEGYFEIVQNTKAPFRVDFKKNSIEVLGTSFNASAYDDDAFSSVTLVNGSINILNTDTKESKLLRPGQQINIRQSSMELRTVNSADVIAWKDGLFSFTDTDLKDVMSQLSRWYNVEVDYSSLPKKKFDGEISRDLPLGKVLRIINSSSNLSIKLKGRRLTAE